MLGNRCLIHLCKRNSNGIFKNPFQPTRSLHSQFRSKSIGVTGSVLLLVPIGTFCLGTWQVKRRKWKLELIADLENKTKAPAIPFPKDLEDISELEYRKLKLYGEFDHNNEIYIGPRPRMVDGDVKDVGGGLISSGESGYNVVTPFKLLNEDITILVNRGWVSRPKLNPSKRLGGQVEGAVEITGVVRNHENRGQFMPENNLQSKIFMYRDLNAMSKLTGSKPIYVDAIETFPEGPEGSQTRITLRNEHLSYIVTWYTLSLATSYMWFIRFVKRRPLM